ncbi:MAG: sulfatase [Planctomycetota bacterium]|nr:sulfatase [Planctomycetota bacterium]
MINPVKFLLLLSLCFASPLRGDEPRLNVLLIAVDDLRPEINSFDAQAMITPNLDRLAHRGVRFTRAYCSIATCGASRASLMTSLRPTPDRFRNFLTRVDHDAPDATSLPKLFKAHGYTTLSNGKIYHHQDDDLQGWSKPPWRPETRSISWMKKENQPTQEEGRRRNGPPIEAADVPDAAYPDYQICSKTITDLDQLATQNTPFFLACGFFRPHLPFVAPQKYWTLYPEQSVPLAANNYFPRDLSRVFRYTWGELRSYRGIPGEGPVSEEAARQLIRGYRASVSFVDAQIGRLLDTLVRLDLQENTIVVLWGDHGWQLGEHGFWCKHTNFEVATRVPLIISAPGMSQDRACQRLVETIDIYPTLCDLTHLPLPTHVQGKSLVPLLLNPDAKHKRLVFTRWGGGDSVRSDHYRYMEMRADGGRGKLTGKALFDLQADPGENQNLADHVNYATVQRNLQTQLDAIRANRNQPENRATR